jgi:hypothetical protein
MSDKEKTEEELREEEIPAPAEEKEYMDDVMEKDAPMSEEEAGASEELEEEESGQPPYGEEPPATADRHHYYNNTDGDEEEDAAHMGTAKPTAAATTEQTAEAEVEDANLLVKLVAHYAKTLGQQWHPVEGRVADITVKVGGGLVELADMESSHTALAHLRVPAHTRGEAGPYTVQLYLDRLEAALGEAEHMGGTLTLDGEKLTFTPRNHSYRKVEIGTVNGEADRDAYDRYVNLRFPPECEVVITARQAQTLARAAKTTMGYTTLKLDGDRLSIHGEKEARYAEVTPPARRLGGEGRPVAQTYRAILVCMALSAPGAASYTISWAHREPVEVVAHIPYAGRGAELRVVTAPVDYGEEEEEAEAEEETRSPHAEQG